jgi:hypothetical protein
MLLLQALVAAAAAPLTPEPNRRREEQTFLTYPEWFLVHSPAEYASYANQDRPPSQFPFWGHIDQLWSSYARVIEATRPYPFNSGYHVMIVVIATSTTVEYALRSAYENLIGRLSELTQHGAPTAEDRYAAHVAQDYVDFIRVLPWYEYDFMRALRGLWTQTGYRGPNQIRKWERKYALTTEYGIKAAYGCLIKVATKASYGTELLNTVVVLDRAPHLPATLVDYTLLQSMPNGQVTASVPRYEAFKRYATALAGSGANFVEIAGNGEHAKLLLTALVPRDWHALPQHDQLLFEQAMLTQPERKRVALVTTVGGLAADLRAFGSLPGYELEHIYDY